MNGFWRTLPSPIIGLAPMDGVTDAAFRLTVALHARPDITFTEFTSVGDICFGAEGRMESLLYDPRERPIIAQLYGKDPALFYRAAHVVCELGFDGLDINMGCPSRNVASSGSGAALIKTPELAHEIIRAARQGIADWTAGQTLKAAGLKDGKVAMVEQMKAKASPALSNRRPIPVSVKTRLGYDRIVIDEWVTHLLAERPAAITVHGRTLEQMYRGAADWEAIARAAALARETGTRLLGNGDLVSMTDVVRRIRESGVDGVLVGRGTLGAPWFFSGNDAARQACAGTAPTLSTDTVSRAKRFEAMLQHARLFEEVMGARFPRMRKHLAWYCKGFPHAAALRAQMVRASSSADVERIVREFCETATLSVMAPVLAALAAACD